MLILQNISYQHPNKDLLFDQINLSLSQGEKVALIGNNGSGKSTLLQIIAGQLPIASGTISLAVKPYYVPQIFGQYNQMTIAEALGIADKLQALKEILAGDVSEENYSILDDDWTIEERCQVALAHWQLSHLDLQQQLGSLSGGQKTKVFLAGISIHQAEFILLDEPSNHLDLASRQVLYDFIASSQSSMIVVSHDRKLLNLIATVNELNKDGIHVYGGNYDFYQAQKALENNALHQDVQSVEKALRKAKEKERETLERQQKLDARGKKKQEKAGVAKIMMNTLRNNAEKSTSKAKSVHAEKISGISENLQGLRSALPEIDQMKFGFENTTLHKGKILFEATELNYSFDGQALWKENLNIQILSGERIALKGKNGSGKTTLIKLIINALQTQTGTVFRADNNSIYIDQEYSIIDNNKQVFEQAQSFNNAALQEHEIKIRLHRFLFDKNDWDKPCAALSGGEKMRLILCCLTISQSAPDIIILDEPTNNLDIQNIEILTKAIKQYLGTLIVVSHDALFLEQIALQREINLGD